MKRLLLKTMLLLCALIVGSVSAWADEVTLNYIDYKGKGTSSSGSEYTMEKTDVSITNTKFYGNNSYAHFYASGVTTITPADGVTITQINLTASATNYNGYQSGGKITASTGSVSGSTSSTTVTWTGSATGAFTISNNKQIRWSSIVVTYTKSGSGGSSAVATTTTINASGITNTDVFTSTSAGSLTATVKDDEANAVDGATVTWSGNNDAVATINENTGAVTLVAAGTVTFTATYAGVENEYESSSATYEMTVTDSTPTPTHTATFSVNGATTTTDFEEGAAIEFPENPADVNGKTFVGWITATIDGTTNNAPTFVTSATMGQSDVTYYAVFAEGESSAPLLTKMLSTDTFVDGDKVVIVANDGEKDYAIYQETVSNSWVRKYEFDGNVTTVSSNDKNWLTVTASNGNWKLGDETNGYLYSSSSNNLIINATGSDFTLAYSEGNGFTLKYGSRWLSLRTDTDNNTFRLGGTGNAPLGVGFFDIYKYVEGGLAYTGYCTTVVAATVARPTIEVEANPFQFSTTATITCETEGAAIYYRYSENDEWSEYTDQLTITETITIYAKAVKDAFESSVASVTATKNLATSTVTVSGDLTVDLDGETDVKAGTLTAAVTYDEAAVESATVTWSSSNEAVATIGAETGAVTIKAPGTVTFTATYAGNSDYAGATGTKTITVIDSKAPGSQANPYTVSQITEVENGVYVQGIISSITEVSTQYNNATYKISEDGTKTNEFTVYRGKYLDNADFTSVDQISVGDAVVIYGNITTYYEQLQLGQGNYLVSLVHVEKPATPTISPAEGSFYEAQDVTISCDTEGAAIYYTVVARYASSGEIYNGESVTDYTLYAGPIHLGWQNYEMSYTIRAYAEKDGKQSDVAETTITVDLCKHVVVTPLDINLGSEGGTGTLEVSFINYPEYNNDPAGFHYWKETETGSQSLDENVPDWFHISYSADYSTLTYTVDPNTTTEARAIEVDFWVKTTFSDRIHFTQAAVAPSASDSWVLTTDLTKLTKDDVFVIVGDNGNTFALPNNGTDSAPSAVAVTIENDEITSDVNDNLKWNISGNATNGYTFYPNGSTETWLYCNTTANSGSNNNMRVGTGDRKVFDLSEGNLFTKDIYAVRFVSIYNDTDWRGYLNAYLAPTSISFYKYVNNAAVKKPVITVEETFVGSTTATITCATVDATIYYSYDNSTWTEYTTDLTITETTTIYAKAVKNEDESVVVSKTTTKVLPTPTVTIDATGITNTNVYESTAAGSLTATVSYNEEAIEGATVTWSGDNDEVATIDASTGVVTLVGEGSVTFTATYAGNSDYSANTATYEMTVVTPNIVFDGLENPLSLPCIADDTNIHYEASNTTGEINVVVCDAEGNETTYDWFTAEMSGWYVHVTLQSNEDGEDTRTAYIKLVADNVESDILAITQAPGSVALPFSFDGGRDDIANILGMTQNGLDSDDYSSSPKLKFNSTGDNVVLKIGKSATELSFKIIGNSFSGGTFTVQTSVDGTNYTDLKKYTELGATATERFILATDVRYIKWIYTEKKSGNVGLGDIKVQKRMGDATVTLAEACNDGNGNYYGTYSNAEGFIVPEGLTVTEVVVDQDGHLIVEPAYNTGDIVPGNTGVMVSSTRSGNHDIVLSTGGTSIFGKDNCLRASGSEGITAADMEVADLYCMFYRLTMHHGTDLGFYWGAPNGGAFAVTANKAYLAVFPQSATARIQGFSFGNGVVTGISQVENGMTKVENCFDLQGRRIANPTKGLYIQNGKKVVVK